MTGNKNPGIPATAFWPMIVVVMMVGFWARAAFGVGLTAIGLGVWLLMAVVSAAI